MGRIYKNPHCPDQVIADICERKAGDLDLLRLLCRSEGIDTKGLTTNVRDEDNSHDPHGHEYVSNVEVWTDWDKNRITVRVWDTRRARHNVAKAEWMRQALRGRAESIERYWDRVKDGGAA